MFELYNNENKIPKDKYDIIYRFIIDNYFDRNKELEKDREKIDAKEAYNNWVNTILNTKDYNILLYYKNNQIIGFTSFMYKDDYLCLSEVQFDIKYKNKGYLKNMLKEVIKVSNTKIYKKVYGTINPSNELSKQVFTHIGFINTEKKRYEIDLVNLIEWLKDTKI